MFRSLFEADLAGLSPIETEALKYIARFAPISATEVTEKYVASVVQSLLDKRLVVAVGDKLDTYWDIFRDFLNTDGFAFDYTPDLTGSVTLGYTATAYAGSSSIPVQFYLNSPNQYYGSFATSQSNFGVSNLAPLEYAPSAYQRFAARACNIASLESATLSIRGYDSSANVLVLDTGNWPLSMATMRKIAEAALSFGVNYRFQT